MDLNLNLQMKNVVEGVRNPFQPSQLWSFGYPISPNTRVDFVLDISRACGCGPCQLYTYEVVIMGFGTETNPDPTFTAWGPLIRDDYYIQPVTYRDIMAASLVFGLANLFAVSAAYVAFRQTRACRVPWQSAYIWMIWLELAASVVINFECLLHLLKVIRPSFWFYMSICKSSAQQYSCSKRLLITVVLNWSIQVQLLPQIIINRVRIILADRQKGRTILVGTAAIVTLINISVFCIWIPARLQISNR